VTHLAAITGALSTSAEGVCRTMQMRNTRIPGTFLSALALIGLGVAAPITPAADQAAAGRDKAQKNPVPRTDRHGDPLPFGAVARLGTIRFRYNATCVAYSPDGKVLAAGGADNQVRLFDARTGKEVRRLAGHRAKTYQPPHNPKSAFDTLVGTVGTGNVTDLAFAPDGKTLASGGWDDTVRLWDVASGAEVRTIYAHKAFVAAVAYAPDGKTVASRGGLDGTVRLWDPHTGNVLREFKGLTNVNPWRFNRTAALAFSPDSQTLAAGDKGVIHFWDAATGKERQKLTAHLSCLCLTFSRHGNLLASGGVDGKDKNSIRIWDTKTGKELRRCRLLKDEPPIHLAFAPRGDRLAAVVEEDDMHLYDVATGNPLHRLRHYWASRIAYAPDGKTLASVRGRTIRLWDAGTGKELFTDLGGHQAGVAAVAVSPDGQWVASGGEDIRLWEAGTGKLLRTIPLRGPVSALAFAPDGKTLAATGRERSVRLWDVASGKQVKEFQGQRLMLCGLAFSPDSKLLAAGDVQSTIRIWEVATGRQLHALDLQSGTESLSFAFSPDNRTLACAGAWNDSSFLPQGVFVIQGVRMTRKEGNFVLRWDVATGKEVRRYGPLPDKLRSVVFSPDGNTLAAASVAGKICLWEAATGQERLHITAHPKHQDVPFGCSPGLVFSPDGKRLVSASTDGTVRFWDPRTAKEQGRIQGPDGGFLALAFARDGKTLVTGGADTTVLVWDWAAALKAPKPRQPRVLLIR
jgi:WD40 repeat protein